MPIRNHLGCHVAITRALVRHNIAHAGKWEVTAGIWEGYRILLGNGEVWCWKAGIAAVNACILLIMEALDNVGEVDATARFRGELG